MGGLFERVGEVAGKFCYELARPPVKEACAEFLATFVLVLLGDGVMATCTLQRLEANSVLVGAFGWGFALMIAVSIAGGVSGGHVNPAVTLGLATNNKCAWKHVIPNILAQYMASFLAAAVVYVTYKDAMDKFDGGVRLLPPASNATAQIFSTYPQEYAGITTCVFDQILGTALLLIVICAATDSRNLRVPPHTQPMIIGLGLSAIALAFGYNCGAPLNPARDLSPRIFTAVFGWGAEVFSYRNYEWFWVPIFAPHIGGIVGVWLYKVLIELPFKNYSRILEMESHQNSPEERRRCQTPDNMSKPVLGRSISSEDYTGKNLLERTLLDNMRASHEDKSIASLNTAGMDPLDV